MGRDYRRKPADMSRAGKLIQIAGDPFHLGHESQMFKPQPLADSSLRDELANDLGSLLSRLAGECLEMEKLPAVEPGADDVLSSFGGRRVRTTALVKGSFHTWNFND